MHIPALDGLRGFAAYIVFFSHYSLISGIAGGAFGYGGGQIGVMLFFILSGFLMGHLYGNVDPTPSEVLKFLRRRAARVLPLFYVMVIAALLAGIFLPDVKTGYPVNQNNALNHLLLISGVGPFWTIPVECQYYALFCLIWLSFRINRNVSIFLLSILVISINIYPNLLSPISSMRIFTNALSFFVAGTLLSQLGIPLHKHLANILFLICIAALPFLFPRLVAIVSGLPLPKLDARFIYGMWENPKYLIFGILLLYSCLYSSLAASVFGSGIARLAGNISYSLYLWQAPCLFILSNFIDFRSNQMTGFLVANLVVITISYLSFKYIETPARRILTA